MEDWGAWESCLPVAKLLRGAGVDATMFRPLWIWLLHSPLCALRRNPARLFLVDRKLDALRAIPIPLLLAESSIQWYGVPQYFHGKFCITYDK